MAKTILVATDGSTHARKAIALASDLAKLHGDRLCLLHVLLRDKGASELRRLSVLESLDPSLRAALGTVETASADPSVPAWAPEMDPDSVPSGVSEEVLTAVGRGILDEAEQAARAQGVSDIQCFLEDGKAASSVLSVADREKAGMIVMGHRGLRDIDAMTFGSVSNEVSRLASCDVVMIK